MRRFAWVLVLVGALLARAQDQHPPDQPKETGPIDALGIEAVNYDEQSQRVLVDGRSILPEGTVLIGTFLRGANPAGYSRAEVAKEGKFALSFDARSASFFPGKYLIRVEYRALDQGPEVLEAMGGAEVQVKSLAYEFEIGNSEDQKKFNEAVKAKLLGILRGLGQLYREMHQFAGFTIASAVVLERKYKGTLPKEDQKRLFRELDKFTTEFWEGRFRTAHLDFREYKEQVAGGALPDVEKDIDVLLVLLEKWYVSYWNDVAKKLRMDPPERVFAAEGFPRFELEPEIEATVGRIYRGLGITSYAEGEAWAVVSTINPERGKVKGNTYKSYTSKFKVSAPSDDWEFDFTLVNPSVRCRIFPKNEEIRKKVTIVVEIKDFPEARDAGDLNRICEVFTAERWPGYKRISGKSISAPDSTMPNGTRPGYEIVCMSDEPSQGRFKVRQYELYCRWLKRTYAVICVGDPDWFATYAKEFDAVCKSFLILDDPKFLEKAHEEEEKDKEADDAAHKEGGEKDK
ncbi:MAG: hypothetical protein HY720_00115 [Planctomycetes bacterium]|nr:hypothetical protein [Planctomycetota bacterium]